MIDRREFIKKAGLVGLGMVALPFLPKVEGKKKIMLGDYAIVRDCVIEDSEIHFGKSALFSFNIIRNTRIAMEG